jgi:L-threonylcarbamoyladenylate synthase
MELVAALRAGRPVLLPTDTVYGLAARADRPEAADEVYRLKGRAARQPTALVAASVDALLGAIPELPPDLLRRMLPGPFTLVLPNPAGRYPWLCGETPDVIGVRVPDLKPPARVAVEAVRAVLATSANLPGGPDPRALQDVPDAIRAGVAAELDLGPLPGAPSTVLDLTGAEPRVLREGAVSRADALARLDG